MSGQSCAIAKSPILGQTYSVFVDGILNRDDSVVVIKSQPVKAGNSPEDKTEMILDLFKKLLLLKRQYTGAKG